MKHIAMIFLGKTEAVHFLRIYAHTPTISEKLRMEKHLCIFFPARVIEQGV